VGFVGLIVPHALRSLLGPAHHRLLPASFLVGGAFLLACDLLARLSFPVFGTQAPVGALTALVGAPVFFVLLHRLGGGHERS
jgi:iron complex transport system permease protein